MEIPNEAQASVEFWARHFNALQNIEGLSEEGLSSLRSITSPLNIGDGENQIRPGEMGKWDVFSDPLICELPRIEQLLLSGLSAGEVAADEYRWRLHDAGVDPDNPTEVVEFERIQNMGPEEIATSLEHLEALFGK